MPLNFADVDNEHHLIGISRLSRHVHIVLEAIEARLNANPATVASPKPAGPDPAQTGLSMTPLEQAHGYPLLAWTDILRPREERQPTRHFPSFNGPSRGMNGRPLLGVRTEQLNDCDEGESWTAGLVAADQAAEILWGY